MNRIKRLSVLITCVVLFTGIMSLWGQEFAGGSGTLNDPWQVATAGHLTNVRNYLGEAHSNKYFVQTADIDLNVSPWNVGEGWFPIGTSDSQFHGKYNGANYTISNLHINRGDANNIGLFGYCRDANIRNLKISNAFVAGNRWVGILVGDFSVSESASGLIDNCHISGTVSGLNRVGGLVGFTIRSNIRNCSSDATVTGTGVDEVGLGGLVGLLSTNAIVEYSMSGGTVNATNNGNNVGGLVGLSSNGNINNSYSRARVDGGDGVGGLAGTSGIDSNILNSYSTGRVAGTGSVGGLVGSSVNFYITGSYWNTQTSGQSSSPAGSGRTTEQMTFPYDVSTYENWNFNNIWSADVIGDVNNGYPCLSWQATPKPSAAINPQPEHQENNVSVNLEMLSWSYQEDPAHSNPVGFRVYLNTTGSFFISDEFVWVDYQEEQEEYFTSDIFTERLDYTTEYYWRVIPTLAMPPVVSEHVDALNCPIWTFSTEEIPVDPNPTVAVDPIPSDEATEVPLTLERIGWSYIVDDEYTNPVGFRVYISNFDSFGEEYSWVQYITGREDYTLRVPIALNYGQDYFWKVVPTTIVPDVMEDNGEQIRTGGDAENVVIWTFRTEEGTSVEIYEPSLLTELSQNYPNPFNPETTILFSIQEETNAQVVIYNLKGQAVKTLNDGLLNAGEYRLVWNGTDDNGKLVGSGIYFYRLTTEHYDKINKMLLVK